MATIKDPKSRQVFVVPDEVAEDYVPDRRVEVDLEQRTQAVAKKATNRRGRRKVE